MVSKAQQQEQAEKDQQAVIEIISAKRLHQQIANRVDRVGFMMESAIVDQTFTTKANVDAVAAAPTIYVDLVTTKPFVAIK